MNLFSTPTVINFLPVKATAYNPLKQFWGDSKVMKTWEKNLKSQQDTREVQKNSTFY